MGAARGRGGVMAPRQGRVPPMAARRVPAPGRGGAGGSARWSDSTPWPRELRLEPMEVLELARGLLRPGSCASELRREPSPGALTEPGREDLVRAGLGAPRAPRARRPRSPRLDRPKLVLGRPRRVVWRGTSRGRSPARGRVELPLEAHARVRDPSRVLAQLRIHHVVEQGGGDSSSETLLAELLLREPVEERPGVYLRDGIKGRAPDS